MLKIAADSEAFGENVQRALGGARILISEADFGVHPVAHRLHPGPSRRHGTKQLERDRRKAVYLAISAVEIAESVVRQFLRRKFAGVRVHRIGMARVGDKERVAQTQSALRSNEPGAAISETIDEGLKRGCRLQAQLSRGAQVGSAGR